MPPDFRHQLVIEREVVNTQQLPAKVLVRFDEMMEIGARVVLAGVAMASGIKRLFREFVCAASQSDFALRSKRDSALCELGGDDAIKHIHATMHGFEDVNGGADSHEITWTIHRHMLGREVCESVALFVGFADREPADRETVEG